MDREKQRIEPVGDRILIKPEPEEETVKGGIIIPTTAQEKPQIGLILEMGPMVGVKAQASSLAAGVRGEGDDRQQLANGQRVLYGKFSGTEITVDSEAYLILRDVDILAILHSPGGA